MKNGPDRYQRIPIVSLLIILILSACGPTTSAPYRDYYVSTTGTDASGRGTSSSRPWQTIQYAIDHADYSGASRVRINVAAGTYTENLTIDNTRAGGTLGAVNIVGAGSGDPLSGSGLTIIVPATSPATTRLPHHTISGGVRVELYDLTFLRSRLAATGGSLYMQNVWFAQTQGFYAVFLRDVGLFNLVDCELHTPFNVFSDYAVEIINSVGTIRGGYYGDFFDHVIDILLSGSPTDSGIIGDGYAYRSGASHVTIEGVTIHGSKVFYADGIRVSNRATAIIRDSTITRDPATAEAWIPGSSDGMAAGINLLDPQGPGGSTVEISDNTISGFDVGIGLDIGGYRVKASGNDISGLTDVVRTQNFYDTDEATPRVDFGGGPEGSPGGNTFHDVGMYAVNHQTPYEVYACFNDWQVADSQIENRIHDQLDDPSVGPVYWEGREGAPCGTASAPLVAETPTLGTQVFEIFTDTPTITPTPAPPMVTLTKNGFCRKGAGTIFSDVTGFEKGTQLLVEGRNDDPNTWLLVRVPNGGTCWISYSVVEPIDLTLLPILPTPIPPSPTPPPSNPQGCLWYDQQQNQACFPIDKCPVPFNQSLGACKP